MLFTKTLCQSRHAMRGQYLMLRQEFGARFALLQMNAKLRQLQQGKTPRDGQGAELPKPFVMVVLHIVKAHVCCPEVFAQRHSCGGAPGLDRNGALCCRVIPVACG